MTQLMIHILYPHKFMSFVPAMSCPENSAHVNKTTDNAFVTSRHLFLTFCRYDADRFLRYYSVLQISAKKFWNLPS